MHIVFYFLSWTALFFITIGDLILAILRLILMSLLTVTFSLLRLIATAGKQVKHLGIRAPSAALHPPLLATKKKAPKRTRKNPSAAFFPSPIWLKLRYFLVGFLFSFIFLFLPLIFLIFLQELPHPSELTTRQIPQTTKIFDRNGILLYEIYASQNRTLVPLSAIPKHLQLATLAIEDKNFYKHPGFDLTSIIRALKENNEAGMILQGGSTITQQLIKSSMLSPEQHVTRKIKEIILAFWTERIYSKDQILEMYFNQVPYGGTAWGVEAASEIYFNKSVKDLTLAESTFLAGVTQAPSLYSPYGTQPTRWKNRQKEVLKRMVSLGFISQKQADSAALQTLTFSKQHLSFYAPHFVNYVREFLENKYGLAMVEKGGLQVTTSLDLKLQDQVQTIVSDEVDRSGYLNLTNGAALVTNPKTGDILAMVGSKDFNDSNGGNVNVTSSSRQPGSTVKVITYSAALSNGFTAASIINDSPASFPSGAGQIYTPVNYDGRYRGNIPLRLALANSLNIPAVKVLQQVGVPTMIRLGRDMGVSHWDQKGDYGLSITLGAAEVTMLDMATVNGTLANLGERVDLNPILKITNFKGTVLEQKTTVSGRQILQPGVAFIISDILSDNAARSLAFGPSSPLVIPGHTVSVKTGTTDNKRDNWTNGYTPDYVVSAWVGNNDNSPMSPTLTSGITGAAPIWNKVMTLLLKDKPNKKQPLPIDVVTRSCFGRTEYFLKGTENSSNCKATFPSLTPPRTERL